MALAQTLIALTHTLIALAHTLIALAHLNSTEKMHRLYFNNRVIHHLLHVDFTRSRKSSSHRNISNSKFVYHMYGVFMQFQSKVVQTSTLVNKK